MGLFAAAPSRGRPFSLGYGTILPSSLTMVAPLASVCSTGPPASVCGTGARPLASGFSGRAPGTGSLDCFPPSAGRLGGDFPPPARRSGDRRFQKPARPVARVTASLRRGRAVQECLPAVLIAYASRPRLRPRLTLGGRAFPRRPRALGAGVSHPGLATRASILPPARSTAPRRDGFAARGKLPYRWRPYGAIPPLRRRA